MLFKLYPIVAASVSWGQEWRRKWITMFCDNEAVLAMINTKRYACATIMSLLRRLTWQSVTLNVIIKSAHIPGHYNVLADSLSRFRFQEFRRLCSAANVDPIHSLNSLLDSTRIFMAEAIAPSTLKAYSHAWALFNLFCISIYVSVSQCRSPLSALSSSTA